MRRSLGRAPAGLGMAAGAAAPGSAATNENLVGAGTITFSWQGEPSQGCAAVALCNVEGAVVADTQGQADVQAFGGTTIVNLDQAAPTVRVLGGPGPAGGGCLDIPEQPGPCSPARGGRQARGLAEADIPLDFTGQLTVTFHGDAAVGCAA